MSHQSPFNWNGSIIGNFLATEENHGVSAPRRTHIWFNFQTLSIWCLQDTAFIAEEQREGNESKSLKSRGAQAAEMPSVVRCTIIL